MTARENTPDAKGVKVGKKPRGSSELEIHRQTTVGASDQPEQRGTKKKGKGHQVRWKAKSWKNTKGRFKRDIPDRSKTKEEKKEQDTYKGPNTGTSAQPGQGKTKRTRIPNSPGGRRTQEEQLTLTEREPADSRTSPTAKEKKGTRGRKAPQKDAGSQAPKDKPQPSEAPGPKRKDTPAA